jgi:hypothetical protein
LTDPTPHMDHAHVPQWPSLSQYNSTELMPTCSKPANWTPLGKGGWGNTKDLNKDFGSHAPSPLFLSTAHELSMQVLEALCVPLTCEVCCPLLSGICESCTASVIYVFCWAVESVSHLTVIPKPNSTWSGFQGTLGFSYLGRNKLDRSDKSHKDVC